MKKCELLASGDW